MKSMPPAMEIELTNRCNLACIQCLRSRGLKPYALGDMDFEDYKKILAQFPYVTNLCLNGFGEPMMHAQFFDVVAYTRRERPWCKIGIYSNGMLIDEEKAYQLMDCGVTEVDISIDAARCRHLSSCPAWRQTERAPRQHQAAGADQAGDAGALSHCWG